MSLQQTWQLYFVPGYCLEVRALGLSGNNRLWTGFAAGAVSGYFNDEASFAACVTGLDKLAHKGIYATCNPVKPELLARASNRLVGVSVKDSTTKEEHIAYRRWLRLDLDPIRPSGISSTQAELQAANDTARHIIASLNADGWGSGILATSGNGMDILYQIELPNDPASKELVKNTLAYLHERFSTELVHVDTNLVAANLSTKVYGTVARKGDNLPDRPHRRSAILDIPVSYGPINEHLVKPQPKQTVHHQTNGDAPTVAQVEEWLSVLPQEFGSTPEGYRQWYSVLMAVHSAIGEEGIELCERYIPGKPNEIASKFHSFNGHGTGIGTLIHLAKQHGWTPPMNKVEHTYQRNSDESSTADIDFDKEEDTETGELGFDIYNYPAEDGGILDAWLSHYGEKWLFNASLETWLYWNGTHWQPDRASAIAKEIQWLMKAINLEATSRYNNAKSRPELAKAGQYIAASQRTNGRVTSVINLAKSQKGITAERVNFGNSLNVANGVLDLDTYKLSPHDLTRIFTYCLPYAYDLAADCTRWKQFVREVLVKEDGVTPDEELILLTQELIGYSLTNMISHQVMIWLAGPGGNGKSVMIGVVQKLLGVMATSVDFHTLGTVGNYDLADIAGVRVMLSVEAERGHKINEGIIKKLVDGETIRVRQIYGKPFDLVNVGKIWWAMNDKPVVRDTSRSIWRRLKLIPFNRIFRDNEKDIFLHQKLEAELAGILAWALEGLARLRKQGHFTQAAAVEKATAEYADESNVVKQWMTERTIEAESPTSSRDVLYPDYVKWATDNGFSPLSSKSFSGELGKLVKSKRVASGNLYAVLFSDPVRNL